jgi:hypothetical protein
VNQIKAMDDSDLAEIRAKRMAQLRQEKGGGGVSFRIIAICQI